ncbi:sulfotransferase [Spirulina sp. CS-785/01]|uniref:sulfotransferase family protein n=1 Tax=Spirulina sp. CS-785/01 TaxID=3021716 RepID=UPI00232D7087|nr:sulfotransferase [Spirulina sp. CS-785/01]MDB9313867.1 sulfotransferase [Spirulina sp. CS-785/01]
MNKFPDFIIIGAGKCGTTSLHNYLDQHPSIFICPQKETYFFLNENIRNNHTPWGAITDLTTYQNLFADAPPNSVIGEISTNYYAYPDSAQIIYDNLPNVKIIAILRDPKTRAFSAYQMFVREGHEQQSFLELIANNPEHKYFKRGLYYQELKPYYDIFPLEQVKVLLFDDLCKNPTEFVKDLFQFLEVDPNFVPDMSKKGRQGGLPKNPVVYKLLTQHNPVRKAAATVLKAFMPEEKRQQIRSKLVKQNIQKVQMSPEAKQQLLDYYREDILKLQELIERDLSSWLV